MSAKRWRQNFDALETHLLRPGRRRLGPAAGGADMTMLSRQYRVYFAPRTTHDQFAFLVEGIDDGDWTKVERFSSFETAYEAIIKWRDHQDLQIRASYKIPDRMLLGIFKL